MICICDGGGDICAHKPSFMQSLGSVGSAPGLPGSGCNVSQLNLNKNVCGSQAHVFKLKLCIVKPSCVPSGHISGSLAGGSPGGPHGSSGSGAGAVGHCLLHSASVAY